MVYHLKNINKWEYLICSVIWFGHYIYVILHALYELNTDFKLRYQTRKLLSPGWIPDVLDVVGIKWDLVSHRDRMDSEWQQFLRAFALMFLLCPAIYTLFDKGTKSNRTALFIVSITILTYLLTFKGVCIISGTI